MWRKSYFLFAFVQYLGALSVSMSCFLKSEIIEIEWASSYTSCVSFFFPLTVKTSNPSILKSGGATKGNVRRFYFKRTWYPPLI